MPVNGYYRQKRVGIPCETFHVASVYETITLIAFAHEFVNFIDHKFVVWAEKKGTLPDVAT